MKAAPSLFYAIFIYYSFAVKLRLIFRPILIFMTSQLFYYSSGNWKG